MKRVFTLLIWVALLGVIIYTAKHATKQTSNEATNPSPTPTPVVEVKKDIIAPFDDWRDRATKKHVGTYVEPGNSPVTPEVFHGYHTGTDFEILPGEETIDVSVRAICTGKVVRKETARGYGGMVVQECTYQGSAVSIVYGHVRLTSMQASLGDILNQGDQFVLLGTGFSAETSNERKHLHLGIHKGGIDTRGYVSTLAETSNWLDIEKIVE